MKELKNSSLVSHKICLSNEKAAKAHISELYQASKMENLGKQVNRFQPLTIFNYFKRSLLDFWRGSEYTSELGLFFSRFLAILRKKKLWSLMFPLYRN